MSLSVLLFVHWKPAEAADRIAALEQLADSVVVYSEQMGRGLGVFREQRPDVVVISLERLPSHGREIALWFRQTKATRAVPLVFVGGAPDKVAVAKERFPDAVFTEWRGIRGAIREARRRPQGAAPPPAVCSTKELWQRLEIRDGSTVALLGAPRDIDASLGAVPESVTLRRQARGKADLVVLFPRSVADLVTRFGPAVRMLGPKGRIWIAWPKRASGVESDVTQDVVRGFGIDQGWTDVKICRIDDVWSGHLFARRR